MSQSHNRTCTPLPPLKPHDDVEANCEQCEEYSDECTTGDVACHAGTNHIGLNDTIGVGSGRSKLIESDVGSVETLNTIVENLLNNSSSLVILLIVEVLGNDTHLVVITKLLNLERFAVSIALNGIKCTLQALTNLVGSHALVETYYEGTTTREVYTVVQTTSRKRDNRSNNQYKRDDVGILADANEINLGVSQEVLGTLACKLDVLTFCQPCLEDDAGDEQRSEQRGDDTNDKGGSEALNRTCTEHEQHDTGDDGGDVRVDNCAHSVLVTLAHCKAQALTGTNFLLNTLVDNHVCIHRHTQSQHDTCDTGQGEHCTKRSQHTKQEEYVAHQSDAGDNTCTVVEENHIEQHEHKCNHKRDERSIDTLGTQRRTNHGVLNDACGGGQFTRFEHVGQVGCLGDVEVTGNLRAATGNLGLYGRCGVNHVVQHDSNALADVCFGQTSPHVGAGGVHNHINLCRATGLRVLGRSVYNRATIQRSLAIATIGLDCIEFIDSAGLVNSL